VAERTAVGVGLIGFGTIGTGVVKLLRGNADVIEQRLGFPLRLTRIADLDLETDRGVELDGIRFDSDSDGLIADPAVDIVIELIGGYEVAKRMILRSIELGKHVVTANKALLALHGKEIFSAAQQRGVDVAFEASVGGGIPILRSLREGLAANRIESVYGIMNGTTNYVLTQMEKTGEEFDVVVKRAQDLGYAEADPSFDLDGIDAAHKLTLLVAMAFGAELTFKEIPTEGIRGLTPVDFKAAREFGYRIKLLGIAKTRPGPDGEEQIEARVHPTLIPESSLLASVDGAMNAVAVTGDAVGPTLFYGAGAGELPTASAVVGDLIEIAREVRRGGAGRVAPLSYLPRELTPRPILPLGSISGAVYLHFTVVDRPGVLGHITGILGEHEIGIESMTQKGTGESTGSVPVLMRTHPARESALRQALDQIDQLSDLTAPTRLIRIEERM
jgi:homoserine dehydrogenase